MTVERRTCGCRMIMTDEVSTIWSVANCTDPAHREAVYASVADIFDGVEPHDGRHTP